MNSFLDIQILEHINIANVLLGSTCHRVKKYDNILLDMAKSGTTTDLVFTAGLITIGFSKTDSDSASQDITAGF
jgi:hypothetical protein